MTPIAQDATQLEQLSQLRELFLMAPESQATRFLAILLSLGLVITVLWLVRRRALLEEYTPIWVAATAAVVLFSLWPAILVALARGLGAWSASSAMFFLALVFLVGLCLGFSIRLYSLTLKVRHLAQELALLRAELEEDAPDTH